MPNRLTIPEQTIPVGAYAHEIDTPSRANRAQITVTRPTGWPAGDVFTYRIFERERTGVLRLLTGATERGGVSVDRNGVSNAPLVIDLLWPSDRDKDVIRFEVDVLQPVTTALTVEFL